MKKITAQKAFLWFLIINSLVSCNKKVPYNYFKGFKNYLKAIHLEINKEEEKIFYVVRIDNCLTCSTTNRNLELLSKIPKNKKITVIVVGKYLNYLKEIKKNKKQSYF